MFTGTLEQKAAAEELLGQMYEDFAAGGGIIQSQIGPDYGMLNGQMIRGKFSVVQGLPEITLYRNQTYGTQFEETFHYQQWLQRTRDLQYPPHFFNDPNVKDTMENEARNFMQDLGFDRL